MTTTVPADQPISERLLIDYGGSVRFGMIGVDNQFGETRVLRQTDTLFVLRAEPNGLDIARRRNDSRDHVALLKRLSAVVHHMRTEC